VKGWAVVTGASSGIGAAFARALDARGYSLLLVARRRERLEELARTLRRAEVLAADLGDEAEVARVAAHALALGDVELLVNNAGFGTNGDFLALDGAREVGMVKLNALTPLELAQHLLPAMVARKSGGIINVSSIGAFQPVPYMATYGATKAFVLSFSEAVAEEVRGTGVRVMALCPGPVPTGFQQVAGSGISPSQRATILTAEDTVRRGLHAYEGSRTVLVPGVGNKLSLVASRSLPRPLMLRTVAAMMQKKRGTD